MQDMTGGSLLVIDDDPRIRALLEIALRRHGYLVHAADCGEVAIELLRKYRPDAVVLDFNMPGMCGADVLRIMQADRCLRRVPVIVATGQSDLPELRGAFATITKPFKLAMLQSVLRDALRSSA